MPDRIVALLPMKANSERVPGKNFRSFNGKPLFRWVLDELLAIEEIGLVVINTDARGLLRAHDLGESDRVLIRDRRREICGDHVSMNLVIEDDVRAVNGDLYVMTHTTNPLLRAETIRRAIKTFRDQAGTDARDSLFSVNRFQSRFYRSDGSAINHDPLKLARTQDLEPWFEENSNLYVFTRRSFEASSARIGRRPVLFETARAESIDIDDEDGWQFAELVSKARNAAGK